MNDGCPGNDCSIAIENGTGLFDELSGGLRIYPTGSGKYACVTLLPFK